MVFAYVKAILSFKARYMTQGKETEKQIRDIILTYMQLETKAMLAYLP